MSYDHLVIFPSRNVTPNSHAMLTWSTVGRWAPLPLYHSPHLHIHKLEAYPLICFCSINTVCSLVLMLTSLVPSHSSFT